MKQIDTSVQAILENAFGGKSPSQEECEFLLGFSEISLEAAMMRSTANELMRKKHDHSAVILGQIGVEVSPCPGGCKFCTFGDGHTAFGNQRMSDAELTQRVHELCGDGDLYGLFLMVMHEYDLSYLLHAVEIAKKTAGGTTQIWVNIGDSDAGVFRELKQAGVHGVYHVCRLGEGIDTLLTPQARVQTMEYALQAGLQLYTCCEPIGPEHSPRELAENLFLGIRLGCHHHAAMRRVAVPNTPLASRGQITELRLAQIVAVVALATFDLPTMHYCSVHEPNHLGLLSGANMITAECGVNPRDLSSETSQNRGMNLHDCRKMLWECGFSKIRRGDESTIPLTFASVTSLRK